MRRSIYSLFGILVALLILDVSCVQILVGPRVNALIDTMSNEVDKQVVQRGGIYKPLPEISEYVQEAVIASQNRRFYADSGISIRGTVRAVIFTLIKGKRQGASTITEQLAKNVFFNDQDNFKTDIETKVLALYITRRYSKQEVLELYLNDIYFGKGAYGIASASRRYFDTSADKLTLAQAAYLIGLIKAPSYFSIHVNEAMDEAATVLQQMRKEGYLTPRQERQTESTLHALVF